MYQNIFNLMTYSTKVAGKLNLSWDCYSAITDQTCLHTPDELSGGHTVKYKYA